MKVTVTEKNFSDMLKSPQPLLLHFWSDFCGPCKVQSRVLEQIDEKYRDAVLIGDINTQNHPDWTEAFGIRSTPTVLVFYKGNLSARLTGVYSLTKIEEIISKEEVLD
ncbi:thioredoxin [Alkalibacterium putridalgicola]|uniref:Thioredoxin n=1 Tax=Alkalibacterium putridalgicola TaxID=426703 RepID=A0A1H7WLT7_9LACT|nr:thioredoxin domain-containing protein [Alkalibacterium putridalgicola]GEK90100.1 thioredoxin [Alkalibacterium putridalgicola]SEM22441.1 thioredoxin [Alkalibacterium putridalgicola]